MYLMKWLQSYYWTKLLWIITLIWIEVDSVWLIWALSHWIQTTFREFRWLTSGLHTLCVRYAQCLKKAIENGIYFWSMRWPFQTAWCIFLVSGFNLFHDVRTVWKCRQNAVLATTLFFLCTRWWGLETLTLDSRSLPTQCVPLSQVPSDLDLNRVKWVLCVAFRSSSVTMLMYL